LRADKQRLGGFVPQFDQANRLAGESSSIAARLGQITDYDKLTIEI